MDERRYLFIMGAMKSGTTSLYTYLQSHPRIATCRENEVAYFCDDAVYARGHDWYTSLWDFDPERHRWAMEHSGNYTKHGVIPSPAARIRAFTADPRFLYIVRDPLERIESHYNAGLTMRWFGYERTPTEELFLAPTRYGRQLTCYETHFPRESILVLDYRDLRRDCGGLLKRIFRFLEIEEDVEIDHSRVVNPTRSLSRGEQLSLRFRGSRLKRLAPRFVRRTVRSYADRRPAPKFRLSDRQARQILARLDRDLYEVIERYGIDPRSERTLQYAPAWV
jgi:hypothetical protein